MEIGLKVEDEKSVRKVCPKSLSEKFVRKVCPKSLPEKFARKVCPKSLPEKFARKNCPKSFRPKSRFVESVPVLLRLEPVGVEVEAERRPVGVVVPVEVGHEHLEQLLLRQVGGAAVDHGAPDFLKDQLVQGHLLRWKIIHMYVQHEQIKFTEITYLCSLVFRFRIGDMSS
jgi:hypothetical protein